MGRRPGHSDPESDGCSPKPKKKNHRKAVPIPDLPGSGEPGCSTSVVAPKKGMVFKTIEDVCAFYNRYAQHVGFATKIKSSCQRRSYIEVMCWRGRQKDKRRMSAFSPRPSLYTSCPAIIKVGRSHIDGRYRLKEVVLEHNHELNPLRMHFFKDGKMMSAGVKKRSRKNPRNSNAGNVTSASWLTKAVEGAERFKLAKEDVGAINYFLNRMQTSNSNFFFLMDIDSECQLRNVFWADGRSRQAYRYFGDVILLDTSYMRSKFSIPLVTFIGVNHHGQSVLMGCGLLSNDSLNNFTWLLQAWLSCMSGHPPSTIITDHGNGLQEAVNQVLPGCCHHLCLWQIIKRLPEKLESCTSYKEIKRNFKKAVFDSLRPLEFEMKWREMVETYSLVYNDWFRMLYQDRQRWVPAFVKDSFCAGLSILRRGEIVESFFDGNIEKETTLKQFLEQYEVIMESKYESEALADFESFHKVSPLITCFYMEEQLAEIYTVDMFTKFQEEVKALVYCHPSLLSTDDSLYTFEVREQTRIKENKLMEQKNYEVIYKDNPKEIRCICCSFEATGILCRHVLSVFNFQDVDEIPSLYILKRWRKDFKGLQAPSYPPCDVVANGPMERYENLYGRILRLVDAGAKSDDKYEFSLKVIEEAMGKILDDNFRCNGKAVNIMISNSVTDQDGSHSSDSNANENPVKESAELPDLTKEDLRPKKKPKGPKKQGVLIHNLEKEQATSANAPAVIHTVIPMAFQQTMAPAFNPWNFPSVNQIPPSNMIYYAAAPVNSPQYGILLPKNNNVHNTINSHQGAVLGPPQISEVSQKSKASHGTKRQKIKAK